MQHTVTMNFAGPVRRANLHGREYLVAPMTLINPGVLSGSNGPLLYPPEEVRKSARDWDGIPIVVNHPNKPDGTPIPALESNWPIIGVVRRASYNGKLRAEGWFDVERTSRVDKRILKRLLAGQPVELSTGLLTENVPTPGTFKGRAYYAVARNYQPDHLAILPDEPGACSLQDGCGVLNARRTLNVNALNETLKEQLAMSPKRQPCCPDRDLLPLPNTMERVVANSDSEQTRTTGVWTGLPQRAIEDEDPTEDVIDDALKTEEEEYILDAAGNPVMDQWGKLAKRTVPTANRADGDLLIPLALFGS